MKNLLFIFLLIVSAKGSSAQTGTVIAQADPNAPVITFVEEMIDFGTVQQNSEQIRTFTFTNTGKSPLVITAIKGQCGCTKVDESWSKEPIQPGATGTFKVKYDTATRIGQFEKKIMVYCNAGNATNGFVEVKIKGNVLAAGAPAPTGN